MSTYLELIHSASIQHHGIKGQKWGVRNGPPYPLSQKKHDSVKGLASLAIYATVAVAIPVIAEEIKQRRLMNYEKRGLQFNEEHKINSMDELKSLKTLDPPPSLEEVVKKINPMYDVNNEWTSSNCSYCALATEMRARGYDVMAKQSPIGDKPVLTYNERFVTPPPLPWSDILVFDKESKVSRKDYIARRQKAVENDILTQSGPNSRGVIVASDPKVSCGHIFNYEVDKSGKVVFYDGQVGHSNETKLFKQLSPSTLFQHLRLDNREFKEGMLDMICKRG